MLGLRHLPARSIGSFAPLFSVSVVDGIKTSKQGNPLLSTMDDITTTSAKSKLVKPSPSRWRPTKATCITVGIMLLAVVVVTMIIGFTVFKVKDPVIAVHSISSKDPVTAVGFVSLKGYPL
ncbi:unnamed protein product, partial [Vitis vinifera]|uniref:Uncharacterized protein n=1 Tax=Vitis vinifera TaxID=29760 RepID=D7TA09_VITVI